MENNTMAEEQENNQENSTSAHFRLLLEERQHLHLQEYLERIQEYKDIKSEIRESVLNLILKNDLFHAGETEDEKAEYASCAMFYLNQRDEDWLKSGGDPNLLAPVFENLNDLLKKEAYLPVLKRTVKEMCTIPTRDQEAFQEWLKSEREKQPDGEHPPHQPQWKLTLAHVEEAISQWAGSVGLQYVSEKAWSLGKALMQSSADEIGSSVASQALNLKSVAASSGVAYAVYMGGVVAYNVYCVAKRDRSGTRALKSIVDHGLTVGIAQLVGLGITLALAPFTGGWSLFFGALGGAGTALIINPLVDSRSCKWLDIPQDELLEQAYNTLECTQKDTDGQVARQYRQKSRMYHPDKFQGEPTERDVNLLKFLKVQAALALIVAAREENQEEYKIAKEDFQRLQREQLVNNQEFIHKITGWLTKLKSNFSASMKTSTLPLPALAILPYNVFEEPPAVAP